MKKKRTLLTAVFLFFLCFFTFSSTSSAQEIATSAVNNHANLSSTFSGDVNLVLSAAGQEAAETQLSDNPIITFLLEHLKINKPTIFAIGITIIGIIFLLISLFLPSLAKQEQLRQRSVQSTAPSRQQNRQKRVSAKEIIAVTGLVFVLIGVVIQTFNQLN